MSTDDSTDPKLDNRSDTTRTALVTGASRGIGAAVARSVANEGLHVLVNYREKAKRAQGIVEDIRSNGGQASTAGADISDEAAAQTLIANPTSIACSTNLGMVAVSAIASPRIYRSRGVLPETVLGELAASAEESLPRLLGVS